jgi:hypothetical protein
MFQLKLVIVCITIVCLINSTYGQDCMQPPCIEILKEVVATKRDGANITSAGQVPAALMTPFILFSSVNFLYAVATDGSSIKIQYQVPWGQYSSRAVTMGAQDFNERPLKTNLIVHIICISLGGFLAYEVLVFVVPDADPTHLHIFEIANGQLKHQQPPIKLPTLPPGTKFTTATIQFDPLSGNVRLVSFFLHHLLFPPLPN